MRSDLHGTTGGEQTDRTILKFDTGARGFRRAIWLLVIFSVLLLGAGALVIVPLLSSGW